MTKHYIGQAYSMALLYYWAFMQTDEVHEWYLEMYRTYPRAQFVEEHAAVMKKLGLPTSGTIIKKIAAKLWPQDTT